MSLPRSRKLERRFHCQQRADAYACQSRRVRRWQRARSLRTGGGSAVYSHFDAYMAVVAGAVFYPSLGSRFRDGKVGRNSWCLFSGFSMEALFLYMLTGLVSGFASGLLGVGGGIIVVPALLHLLPSMGVGQEVATHMALGTSLAAMVATSASSAYTHYRLGNVLVPVFRKLSLGVIFGATLGGCFLSLFTGQYLQLLFAGFLAYVALQMFSGFSPRAARVPPGSAGLGLAGGLIGACSVLFGIGGGTLTVPYLGWCGVGVHRAVATSAALGFCIALWGAVIYAISGFQRPELPEASLGYLYLPALLGIIPTSVFAARYGAVLSGSVPAGGLRKAFSLLLILVSIKLFMRNLGG